MTTESFDLIVIGAGSAAREGAAKAAKGHGARVAMIERERWGGSCPNVACRPTKAYLVAAELAHDVNTLAAKLGIDVGPAGVDLGRVKARKDSLLTPQEKWRERLTEAGYELVEGTASFEDAHTVRVGERRLAAERILVATGSRTALPPIDGLDEVGWLDHVSALEATELPDSLLVVGGGPVGLEFAQAFSRYGSKVTIVDAVERIAFRDDRDAAAELAAALHDDGIEIVTSTFVKGVRRDGEVIVATLSPRDGGDERELRVEQILLASGRVPNVEELELEQAGIEQEQDRDRRGHTPADDGGRRLGGRGRDRNRPVHAHRPVPGPDRGRGHVHGRGARGGLLDPADGDLHRPRARRRRPHRGSRARRRDA